ncbi:hypothetical protein CROQUDRAFT_94759 [Cronartium quercuum f. sp. fusiforme G11]|uniref:Uncharacterized protein n=1 Tax=Cronartium quercuum f. sp. fusiforme G11 TaxID=708437 RepID=A0A9P6NIN4_9BASI|nr:hypothetical protein CROQUDRAFT_94759 [Cronartium quercuum f. sp. fusiforme G11]
MPPPPLPDPQHDHTSQMDLLLDIMDATDVHQAHNGSPPQSDGCPEGLMQGSPMHQQVRGQTGRADHQAPPTPSMTNDMG